MTETQLERLAAEGSIPHKDVAHSRGKQQKVGWSKTMVWPPSTPSQMCMGRGAGNQQNWVCYEHVRKRQVSGPRVTPGSEWPDRGSE